MQADDVRKIVREELVKLKRQLDIEIKRDIDALRSELTKTVDEKTTVQSTQLAAIQQNNDRQLTTMKEATKQLLVNFGTQITKQTYEKVITEVNQKIVPRIDGLIEYVNYQNQDGQEIITDYRRAVDHRVNGQQFLTDGQDDDRILGPHTSLFFGKE
jgi:phage I-like protein